MFTLLKKVNEALQHCLRSKVMHVQTMKPDAQLADLEFTKHGYSTIKHAVKPITVHTWALFTEEPWRIAADLMDQVDRCLEDLDQSKVITFASAVYPDRLVNGEYPEDACWVAFQFVAYTYDEHALSIVEKEEYKKATVTVVKHQLVEVAQTKVAVYPQNIERDYNPTTVHFEDYAVWVRDEFELAVNKGRELMERTLRVLAAQEHIQAYLSAQHWPNAAALFGEILQSEVRYERSATSRVYFSYEDEEYEPRVLLNIVRAKVGLPLLRNPNNEKQDESNAD